jgi:hypothetical protein
MIEFTHETTRYKVKPENAQRFRAALTKPKKYTCEALSSKNLARYYPAFLHGSTTTADYVARFQSQFDGAQHKISHDCSNFYNPAPMLDATQPEVWEEVDENYIEPVKAKKLTAKQAMTQALKALEKGDIDTAQCILAEGLK